MRGMLRLKPDVVWQENISTRIARDISTLFIPWAFLKFNLIVYSRRIYGNNNMCTCTYSKLGFVSVHNLNGFVTFLFLFPHCYSVLTNFPSKLSMTIKQHQPCTIIVHIMHVICGI